MFRVIWVCLRAGWDHFGECVIFGKMLNLSQQQQQQQQSLHALLYLHFSENLEMILIITHQQLQ